MKMNGRLTAVLGLGAFLAACDAPGDDDALIGPDRSFGSALSIAEAQWNEVGGIAAAEGPTRWVDLPASGSGEYRGAITGWAAGGVPIDYVADLALDVDFGRREVSGAVTNMVTDGVAGFTHPDGRIGLHGVVAPDARGAGRIVLDGAGTLRGPGMAADVRIDGAGGFQGTDGRAVRGTHATDFAWTQGYLEQTTSRSDGVFSGLARD
jgi:hypothetical protein